MWKVRCEISRTGSIAWSALLLGNTTLNSYINLRAMKGFALSVNALNTYLNSTIKEVRRGVVLTVRSVLKPKQRLGKDR